MKFNSFLNFQLNDGLFFTRPILDPNFSLMSIRLIPWSDTNGDFSLTCHGYTYMPCIEFKIRQWHTKMLTLWGIESNRYVIFANLTWNTWVYVESSQWQWNLCVATYSSWFENSSCVLCLSMHSIFVLQMCFKSHYNVAYFWQVTISIGFNFLKQMY